MTFVLVTLALAFAYYGFGWIAAILFVVAAFRALTADFRASIGKGD